jgi:monofunctional biosynthetic peptidoglycan transglycosylase
VTTGFGLAPAAETPPAPRRRWRRWALGALLATATTAAIVFATGLPPREAVRALARTSPERTGLMRQRLEEAEAAGRRYRIEHRPVPLKAVSRELLAAVIAAEDARFLEHEGFDWEAVREAARVNWERRRVAFGGSTLSQQLVKNLFFSTHRSVLRKLREAVVTRWLEQDLDKRRILELYVNSVEWGPGIFGCEAAARRWYGISCARLDATQAAGLAAMLPSPRRINPEQSPKTWSRARDRVQRLMELARGARRQLDRKGYGVPGSGAPGPVAVHWKRGETACSCEPTRRS